MTDNNPAVASPRGFTLLNMQSQPAFTLPQPSDLAAMITTHVEGDVAALRAGIEHRGGVVTPADTFEIHRHIQQAAELIAEYLRKFKDVATHLKGLQEEALADATGADAQGNPLSSLTVPDRDGDIRITRKTKNTHTISAEQVLPAFASTFADQHADAVAAIARREVGEFASAAELRAAIGVSVAEAILDALNSVGELGKFDPQVTKVRAYADHLARSGQDAAAGIVRKAIATTREYDGITVERKTT